MRFMDFITDTTIEYTKNHNGYLLCLPEYKLEIKTIDQLEPVIVSLITIHTKYKNTLKSFENQYVSTQNVHHDIPF